MDKNVIYQGDCLEILRTLPDESVNCCVTSPPYYGLRDYGAEGQIGLEKSPAEYIGRLTAVFHELKRVLTRDGTLWLNMGDSYAGSNQGAGTKRYTDLQASNRGSIHEIHSGKAEGRKRKDLMGIPWRLAFALQADGWYLRQDIIWYKPNCMPESVKDRCTRSHEYIFLMSKSEKYYFDNEAIKEPAVTSDKSPPRGSKGALTYNSGRRKQDELHLSRFEKPAPLKRNKRDVWSVSTHGFRDAHFATFPEKLIEPCILAGCPKDGIVIDPFIGSGTTAVSAKKNDRNYIGIELNPEYADMARKRLE